MPDSPTGLLAMQGPARYQMSWRVSAARSTANPTAMSRRIPTAAPENVHQSTYPTAFSLRLGLAAGSAVGWAACTCS